MSISSDVMFNLTMGLIGLGVVLVLIVITRGRFRDFEGIDLEALGMSVMFFVAVAIALYNNFKK